jgi:two-component system cell cycle sensor histidine kinase/response regulator CckA
VTVAGAPVAPPTAGRRRGVDRGGAVSVSVADTGSGMSAEVKLRMFEPFFTTKNAAKGTGLGLCTVYGIVKQTRGHIAVESIVGQGTCITVHFPDAGGAPPPESQRVVTALLRGTETVLLVEDESSVRALVRAVLIRCGYTVIEAEDGELALEVSDQHTAPIQLMITDVVMPKMNGPELAHAMEQRRPGIKVLFMSGYIDGTALDSGHDAPAPFIQKPFVADALSRVVRDVLDAPAPIRESIATV